MYHTRIEPEFQRGPDPAAKQPEGPAHLTAHATLAPPAQAEESGALGPLLPRCRQRGCVYPAAGPQLALCIHHFRERREPSLFLSRQPSLTLLDRARFGLSAQDDDIRSRSLDRQRFAHERETFLDEAA